MTDPFPLNSQTASLFRSNAGFAPVTVKHESEQEHEEVEDYTIKCICGFQEDDGNTVYCDRCDTWQHTECYYVDALGRVLSKTELEGIEHFCADCDPRNLDPQAAIERQKNRRKEIELGDRKAKKAASKSHKKKTRAPDSVTPLTNGWAQGNEFDDPNDRIARSPRDTQPANKRVKTSHRSSNSMNAALHPSNLTSHPHKRSASTLYSPSKARNVSSQNSCERDSYSIEFLHLYDNDPGDSPMQTNLLNDIKITQDLSAWSSDLEELRNATNLSPSEVFNRCEQPIDSMIFPQLNKETKQDESSVFQDRHPRWIYLTIDSYTPKNSIVGELKGKIGLMLDYIQEPSNRWDYLRHPAPFVFFHQKLPIYIDTRSEGTTCRYLRRSCTPNLSMKTFLEGSDYHFCFVAKREIEAGEELTIGWVLDEHIRKYLDRRNTEEVRPEVDSDEDYLVDWVVKVLAEFGGCACNSPDTCVLAKYERRSMGVSKSRNGYSGKPSPRDDGDTSNSRASSEQGDGRSSSRSKSRSRDISPTRNSHGDVGVGPGLEISDREKRKIAALEKNFEQLENDKHQPAPKKKKRNSGGTITSNNTPSSTTSKQVGQTTSVSQPATPGLSSRPHYTDASTSQRKPNSPIAKTFNPFSRPRTSTTSKAKKRSSLPNTPTIPSPLVRQNYVSQGMQTDPDEVEDWYSLPRTTARPRKPFMSLTKRLLLRSQQDRIMLDNRRRASAGFLEGLQANGPAEHSGNVTNPAEIHGDGALHNVSSRRGSPVDSPLLDQRQSTAEPTSIPDIQSPPSWSAAEHSRPVNGFRQNDLRVQLPVKMTITSDSTSNTPLVETPTSAVPQSPFTQTQPVFPPSFQHSSSNLVQPSPAKKKVSLGEYFSRRKGSQPATEAQTSSSPPIHQSTFKAAVTATNGESKDTAMVDSAFVDTPKKEESDSLVTG
ncbi:hypothetical protein MMC21_005013 [Puttea exsequens]|nr:hypothetical protein [Puttea exsequens]